MFEISVLKAFHHNFDLHYYHFLRASVPICETDRKLSAEGKVLQVILRLDGKKKMLTKKNTKS
jgi:hypothetical protein